MVDPEMRLLLELGGYVSPVAYFISPDLCGIVSLKMLGISLQHGHCSASSEGYMAYALFIAHKRGRYEEAYEYGVLGLELSRKFGRTDVICKLTEMFSVHFMFYKRHLRETLAYLDLAYQAGLSTGDASYLCYTVAMTDATSWPSGRSSSSSAQRSTGTPRSCDARATRGV